MFVYSCQSWFVFRLLFQIIFCLPYLAHEDNVICIKYYTFPLISRLVKNGMTQHQFDMAIELIDTANGEDPNLETSDTKDQPKELLY